MKKTNKVLLTLTSLVLALGLFACNKNKNSSPDESSDNISDSTISEIINSESESVGNTSSPSESEVVVVYELSLSESSLSLIVGQSQTVQATLLKDGEICDDAIEWVSSNESVAKVENGKVIAVSAGNATITASSHGKQATVDVEVEEEIGEVFLIVDPERADLEIGETLQLNAQLLGSEEEPQLTYYSSNDSVATVDLNTGLVTARGNGDATITIVHGEVEDGIMAYCEVSVQSSVQLIFPEISKQEWFVGDVIDTNAMIKADGSASQEGIVITGNGFTVNGDEVTITDDGLITITVSYEGQQPISREIMAYHKIATAQDWANVNNDLAGYYKLANNIDLKGGVITTIAHYADQMNSSTTGGFSGVIDGNGYAIMNYSKSIGSKGSTTNSSPIGQIAANGVVKNLNFINGTIDNYIGGGIATINNGIIENCYVDVFVKFNPATNANSKNNPLGGIASKNYNTIRNCVAVVRLADGIDTTMIGAIAGRNASASAVISNTYAMSTLGICESATPSNAPTNPLTGTITNVSVTTTLDELNALVEANTTFDKSLWNVTSGRYPVVGKVLDLSIALNQTEYSVFAGTNVTIEATSATNITYTLKQPISGVSVDANGKVTVDDSVATGTDIEVVLSNSYSNPVTVTITVNALSYSVDASSFNPLSFDLIIGESSNSDYVKAHNIIVKYNNEVYKGDAVSFVSSNNQVATADATNVTAVGNGTATISVKADGSEIYSFEVKVELWNAVKTTQDFLAMGNNLSGKYKLMNNIDFEGATIVAFSSWKTMNDASAPTKFSWTGAFDGQGYTVSNFTVDFNKTVASDRDRSIFGYMSAGSSVKNVNFVGAKGADRASIVSSWCEGTIENVYAELTYTANGTNRMQANPGGIIAMKARTTAVIKNCIAVVTFASGTTSEFIGGVVGLASTGAQISDCLLVCEDSQIQPVQYLENNATPVITNCVKYADVATLLSTATLTGFDKNVWSFVEGKYPHVGQMANIMSTTTTEYEVYANNSVSLKVKGFVPVYYKLAAQVSNVTVNEATGEVSVGQVAAGTDIEVVAYNLYTNETITLTITVKAATVSVDETNYVPLSFDIVLEESGVSETVKPHNLVLKQNGEVYTGEDVEYVSSNPSIATADATNVTAIGDGIATITIKIGGAELYSFDVTVVAWTPVRTIAEFEAIENNLSGKYKLIKNLDYQGGYIKTIAHYAKGHTTVEHGFLGIFDGNGYSIMNFAGCVQMNGASAANCSPFGHIGGTGIVRNVNFIGGTIATRIAGGIATVNYGTIENCYVDVYVTYNKNNENNNPIGGIVSKNYNTVKNCVAVVTLADGIYDGSIGTIAGRNWEGNDYITNCYGMSTVGVTESGIPTNGYTTDSAGSNITNSAVYSTLAELNAAINNDATFNKSLWTVVEGKYPHVGQMANIMSVVDTEMEAYTNATATVKVNSGIDVYYKLASEVSNVSINETTGVVTIGDVVVGTNIEVVAYNLYTSETETVTITVVDSPLDVTNPNPTMTISDKIIGETVAHNVVVTKNGEVYNGEDLTYTSDNENVVVADATNITIKGEGTAVVTVASNGTTLTTITVTTSALWTPITTVAEFNAIENNLTGKYKLMNDLDYQGGTLTTIAHWNSGAGNGTNQFSGIFDGQGYTIKNFVNNNTSTNGNYSLFGTVNTAGVIRNLNVSGTLAARIAGGIVTINNGTVENCFANISITYTGSTTSDGNNPMGGIASKNTGTIKNCVTIVSVSGTNTSVIGAIVGRNTAATAKVENCYSMTSAAIKLYSNTGNTTEGTNIISSSVVTSLEALNNAISNDATFDKVNTWTVATGSNPKVKVQA